jgi:hypothetical protein
MSSDAEYVSTRVMEHAVQNVEYCREVRILIELCRLWFKPTLVYLIKNSVQQDVQPCQNIVRIVKAARLLSCSHYANISFVQLVYVDGQTVLRATIQ